jgi:protein kinase 1
MELMSCSLHELMHGHAFRGLRRHVTWADSLLAIATDVTSGMTFLHYHNVIHRDLKPLNVLMTDGWTAKVADFGEVKLIKGGGDAGVRAAVSTASGVADETHFRSDFGRSGGVRIHGTPSYVSPEAASVDIPSAPRVGKPTDVWSFGCLLAHCAARAPPYTDIELASVHDVIQQLRDGRAKPLSMVVEGDNMPALLVDIARECTRIVPEQRPTFAQLSQRLSAPSLVREICFKDAVIDEEEEDDLEARRPLVRLSVPTTLIKEPSAVVGSASGDGRLASGSVASISKPKSMDHNACVIS